MRVKNCVKLLIYGNILVYENSYSNFTNFAKCANCFTVVHQQIEKLIYMSIMFTALKD